MISGEENCLKYYGIFDSTEELTIDDIAARILTLTELDYLLSKELCNAVTLSLRIFFLLLIAHKTDYYYFAHKIIH